MVFWLPSILPITILLLPPSIVKSCPIATELFEPVICVSSPAIIVANEESSIDEVFDCCIALFSTDCLIVFSVPVFVLVHYITLHQ